MYNDKNAPTPEALVEHTWVGQGHAAAFYVFCSMALLLVSGAS